MLLLTSGNVIRVPYPDSAGGSWALSQAVVAGVASAIPGTAVGAAPTANVASGKFLTALGCADNIGTTQIASGGTEHSFASVPANTWTKRLEARQSQGVSAADGATASVHTTETVALTTSDSLTLTTSASTDVKAMLVSSWTATGTPALVAALAEPTQGVSTIPITISGLEVGRQYLLVGWVCVEAASSFTYTMDGDYTLLGSAIGTSTGGPPATNVTLVAGYRIVSGISSDTFGVTGFGVAYDHVSMLAVFEN